MPRSLPPDTDALLHFIREQAAAHELPPWAICFEITETATINNLRHAREFVTQCKALGMLFALDDFGTGTPVRSATCATCRWTNSRSTAASVRNMQSDRINRAMTAPLAEVAHLAHQAAARLQVSDPFRHPLIPC